MIDGHLLVDAHQHPPRLPTLKPSWLEWAREFSQPGLLDRVYDDTGAIDPVAFDAYMDDEGVDVALLFSEYSPKATGYQEFDDLLPIVKHNPARFRPVANVNPHLHHPVAGELERQLGQGAVALKVHPVHGGFAADDSALYPAYEVCRDRGVPVIVHCGTSTFPGSENRFADPVLLDRVLRDFPTLTLVLAHGGRGWWYDAAAFLALANPHVWIELSGLPPRKLPEYYARHDFARLARRFIFATDWPGAPKGIAHNARAVASLCPDDETRALVLGQNARRIYRLEG